MNPLPKDSKRHIVIGIIISIVLILGAIIIDNRGEFFACVLCAWIFLIIGFHFSHEDNYEKKYKMIEEENRERKESLTAELEKHKKRVDQLKKTIADDRIKSNKVISDLRIKKDEIISTIKNKKAGNSIVMPVPESAKKGAKSSSKSTAEKTTKSSATKNQDRRSTLTTTTTSKSSADDLFELKYTERTKIKCDGYEVKIPDGFKYKKNYNGRDFIAWRSKNRTGNDPETADIVFYSSTLTPTDMFTGNVDLDSIKVNQMIKMTSEIMAQFGGMMGMSGSSVHTDVTHRYMAGAMTSNRENGFNFHYPNMVVYNGYQQFRVDIHTSKPLSFTNKYVKDLMKGVEPN